MRHNGSLLRTIHQYAYVVATQRSHLYSCGQRVVVRCFFGSGGKDLALAVGGGRVRKGKSVGIISWGAGDEEGILLQRKQNGG